MAEVIMITSGKGGVGKSSVCVNLGTVLAQRGFRVCMIDVDLGLKNLDVMLGLENRVMYDLMDVLEHRTTLEKAILRTKHEELLYLLPACKSLNITQVPKDGFIRTVEELRKTFDYILLDTPAGIEKGFIYAGECADRAVIVTTLDVTALQDADRIIGLLLKEGMADLGFVLNRVDARHIEKGSSVSIEDATAWLAIEMYGYVFEDEAMIRGNNTGKVVSIQKESNLYSCFSCITKRILGEQANLPKIKERSIFDKIFG